MWCWHSSQLYSYTNKMENMECFACQLLSTPFSCLRPVLKFSLPIREILRVSLLLSGPARYAFPSREARYKQLVFYTFCVGSWHCAQRTSPSCLYAMF